MITHLFHFWELNSCTSHPLCLLHLTSTESMLPCLPLDADTFNFRFQTVGESLLWCLKCVFPSFTGICRTVEKNIFSLLSPAAVAQQHFPLTKYIIPEVLPPLPLGSVLLSSVPSCSQLASNLSDAGESSTAQ